MVLDDSASLQRKERVHGQRKSRIAGLHAAAVHRDVLQRQSGLVPLIDAYRAVKAKHSAAGKAVGALQGAAARNGDLGFRGDHQCFRDLDGARHRDRPRSTFFKLSFQLIQGVGLICPRRCRQQAHRQQQRHGHADQSLFPHTIALLVVLLSFCVLRRVPPPFVIAQYTSFFRFSAVIAAKCVPPALKCKKGRLPPPRFQYFPVQPPSHCRGRRPRCPSFCRAGPMCPAAGYRIYTPSRACHVPRPTMPSAASPCAA